MVDTIRAVLSDDDQRQLLSDAKYATDWVCEVVRRIVLSSKAVPNG